MMLWHKNKTRLNLIMKSEQLSVQSKRFQRTCITSNFTKLPLLPALNIIYIIKCFCHYFMQSMNVKFTLVVTTFLYLLVENKCF